MATANDTLSRQNRLPTLTEVLNRQTRPPVDLFSFYIYMRDQQRSVDYLDFWLDVSQHMSLCRHFVREMRRSVLLETPDLEKAGAGSKRSSQILDQFEMPAEARGGSDNEHSQTPPRTRGGTGGTRNDSMTNSQRQSFDRLNQDQRVSQILRSTETGSMRGGHAQKDSTDTRNNGGQDGMYHDSSDNDETRPRPSFMSSNIGAESGSGSGSRSGRALGDGSPAHDTSSTPHHTVTRADIRASAEKILYTFLLQGSEREIILPQSVLLEAIEAVEEHGRDDPEVFDAAKEYVFQAMERDAFPGFLHSKALGNLVPPTLMLRLICGLLAIFGAFWTAFVLVFLDKDRATRCWIILPFLVGIYLLASHQYTVDPILAFAGFSEYTPFNFTRIREPFVRKLLIKRAAVISVAIALITVAVCCLFIFVPGKRL